MCCVMASPMLRCGCCVLQEIQRTLMELLSHLDGFDAVGKVLLSMFPVCLCLCLLASFKCFKGLCLINIVTPFRVSLGIDTGKVRFRVSIFQSRSCGFQHQVRELYRFNVDSRCQVRETGSCVKQQRGGGCTVFLPRPLFRIKTQTALNLRRNGDLRGLCCCFPYFCQMTFQS